MNKEAIIRKFNISSNQEKLLDTYIFNLKKYNKHTNLVGSSTLEDPWKRHILDCLQILPKLNNYNCSILDMGTGAGLPGLLLSIMGCQNVTLVDSNNKKTKFLEKIKKNMNLKVKIILDFPIKIPYNLKNAKNINKRKFKIIEVPMPKPIYIEKVRVPASYLNFYIANKIVLLPIFNDQNDKKVILIFKKFFKNKKIVPIDCTKLIWGFGAIHCMTQPEPKI